MGSQQETEAFKVERYKVTIKRQEFYANLAREIFYKYSKSFVVLTSGALAFLSAKEKLEISKELIPFLLNGISTIVTIIGAMSVFQIVFSLVRWFENRRQEIEQFDDKQLLRRWIMTYELLYIVAILSSIAALWIGTSIFKGLIK